MRDKMELREALKRIEYLEKENKDLRLQLEQYKNRKSAGRKKHDEKWKASYDAWEKLFEAGLSAVEIMKQSEISRRTYYRYKAYYEQIEKRDMENGEEKG